MLKKYITTLPYGALTQNASVLGRNVTLTNGEVVTESVITQALPRFFTPYTEPEISNEEFDFQEAPDLPVEDVPQILVEDSSNVSVTQEPEEAEKPKTRGRKSK